MQRFWDGAAVNTTGPTAFEGQASGHWTLGNLYVRAPVQSERIATVNLPSFRAGCGGIDAFAGSFSFIDSDQLVAFARGIAQNATGFAFELALETISPVIAETMSKLRALANWVNNQSINSCEMASVPGGGVVVDETTGRVPPSARPSARRRAFSRTTPPHGTVAGPTASVTPRWRRPPGNWPAQVPVNVNYAWRAVRDSAFLSGDQALGEFAMSLSGTMIVTAPVTDSSTDTPQVAVLEPLALDREVTEILMEGGGDLPVYACDTPANCLEPTLGRVTIPAGQRVPRPRGGHCFGTCWTPSGPTRPRPPTHWGSSISPRCRFTGSSTPRPPTGAP